MLQWPDRRIANLFEPDANCDLLKSANEVTWHRMQIESPETSPVFRRLATGFAVIHRKEAPSDFSRPSMTPVRVGHSE